MIPQELSIKHQALGILFQYGTDIPENKLYQLFALPHAELRADLYEILRYGSQTERFYMQDLHAEKISEAQTMFMTHAVQMLAELGATEMLQDIGYVLAHGWNSYQFWFGNLRPFWAEEPLYILGRNQLRLLEDIYLSAPGHLFPRCAAVMAMAKVAHRDPGRLQDVEERFLHSFDILHDFTRSMMGTDKEEELALFTSVVPALVEEAVKLQLSSVVDRAVRMVEETGREPGLSAAEIRARHKDIEVGMPPLNAPQPDIYARYRELNFKIEANLPKNEVPLAPFTEKFARLDRGPVRKSDKVGRNEPCPCGSGKKYKKCCG